MIKPYIPKILLFILLTSTHLFAISTQYIVISLENIIIPIPLEPTIPPIVNPDTTPPSKPTVTTMLPSSTYDEQVYVEIRGEVGSTIYVNNQKVGTISSTGKYIITLDTSGSKGTKKFNIILKDSANNTSQSLILSIEKIADPKFDIAYKGLTLYHKNLTVDAYALTQLTDERFNSYSQSKKLTIANTLLSTLFFGYAQNVLLEKINSGTFISDVREGLAEDRTDKAWVENYILDKDKYEQFDRWAEPQAINILSRFSTMHELDSYFLKNWTAYILTQTIMFSPAYELESSHTPNIAGVYNRIVTFLNEESGMRYLTYVHMMSEDNWRRFRSPEDNGREMLEIYLQDAKDSHVPIAAQALQNWKLNTDSDTLEVSLKQNRTPLALFETTIVNGDDFYRELVKSDLFTQGVVNRLVDFFFPQATQSKKDSIAHTIVSSHPETWQDILMQVVFSETYLLHNPRAKSMEELFFSLTKKSDFMHNHYTSYYLKKNLEKMHQASMKYKLGKLNRVPMDTLSFAYSHKFLREEIFLRRSDRDAVEDYSQWNRHGWGKGLVASENFTLYEENPKASIESFIHSLFQNFIYRDAKRSELDFFISHMMYDDDAEKIPHWTFDLLTTDTEEGQTQERENRRAYITYIVLDYLSRLDDVYLQKEVQ